MTTQAPIDVINAAKIPAESTVGHADLKDVIIRFFVFSHPDSSGQKKASRKNSPTGSRRRVMTLIKLIEILIS